MNKLTSILSKIAATLNIDGSDKRESYGIVGKWKALTYSEKLYENRKLVNDDNFSYTNESSFHIIFKNNGSFIQIERSEGINNKAIEKTTRKGVYTIQNDKIILSYGSIDDKENAVTLSYSIKENNLTTINDYEQKDVDDVYHHVSTRTFVKE